MRIDRRQMMKQLAVGGARLGAGAEMDATLDDAAAATDFPAGLPDEGDDRLILTPRLFDEAKTTPMPLVGGDAIGSQPQRRLFHATHI